MRFIMDRIYQDIWNADQMENGIPALRPNEARDENVGYVIVDERANPVGADHNVLSMVKIPEHKKTTYRLCEKLFDNYALARKSQEHIDTVEIQEELDFITTILDTNTIKVAHTYLEKSLDRTISKEILAAMIKETWFEMGRAGSQKQASGFEHVFVGEQASKSTKIGGYHFWYKYFIDDGGKVFPDHNPNDDVRYHGTKYGGAINPEQGILVPEVVTLSLTWNAPAGDDNSQRGDRTLSKPIGGFFVGCSPECLIALGLVRCRTKTGKLAKINAAEYLMDLHRLDGNPNAIRTFFPRFRKADVTAIDDDLDNDNNNTDAGTDDNSDSQPTGTFQILAAMVNPENPEGGREFVQIINISDSKGTLKNWKLVAPNGVTFHLADIEIEPGDIFKFQIPKNQGVLRNKAGTIKLLNPENNLIQSCEYSTDQAQEEGKVILF